MHYRNGIFAIIGLMIILCGNASQTAAAQGTSLPAGMTGSEWALVTLQSAPGTVSDITGKGLTIRFDAAGTVSGSNGCNNFAGGYTVGSGQQITIGPLASTLIGCEPAIATLETEYMQAIQGVTSYTFDGSSKLQLNFANGQGLLSYTKGQPAPLPQTGGPDDSLVTLAILGLLFCGIGFSLRRTYRRMATRR